jgi:hypothetical protein
VLQPLLFTRHCPEVNWHQSQSQSDLIYDWWFTTNQFVLAPSPLRPTTRIFPPNLNTCGHSPYVTFSLTRGWVCRLQLLVALVSAFILGSESRGTRDHILLSQIRDFPFCRLLRLAGHNTVLLLFGADDIENSLLHCCVT